MYYDDVKNTMIAYYCMDGRLLSDSIAVGLSIPDWASSIFSQLMELFQTFHWSMMIVATKGRNLDEQALGRAVSFIESFTYVNAYPFSFAKDFTRASQDSAKCGV